MSELYLGIDVGSVSVKAAVLDESENLLADIYLASTGEPIRGLKTILTQVRDTFGDNGTIRVGTTGSGRKLIGAITGAEVVKNEIISHAVAAIDEDPAVRTIIDIGGQDSKLILVRDRIATDFAMNTVCAAGTGSFLEQQSHRLGIPIDDFGAMALRADREVNIAGRCTVFAESDMISLQQMGESRENIVNGLCLALVRNYMNNLARGKEIHEPIVFQGGVAANRGIVRAFESVLGMRVTVPANFKVMGAIGVALIARRYTIDGHEGGFRGFGIIDREYQSKKFVCDGCENSCNVFRVMEGGTTLAYWGDRCGKWSIGPAE